MKYGFPLNNNYSGNNINKAGLSASEKQAIQELKDNMLKEFRNQMKPNDDKEIFDKYACEVVFARVFVTEDMRWEFPLIARDFIKNEIAHIPEYKDLSYGDGSPESGPLDTVWTRTIMHLIYNGYKSGSVYCKNLLQYLFKTYHKKLYKSFKRFNTINQRDLYALAADEYGDEYDLLTTAAIIMCMADVFGIKLDSSCNIVYPMFGTIVSAWEENSEIDYLDFPEGLFIECIDQIKEMFGPDDDSAMKRKDKSDKFVRNVCRYYSCTSDFVYINKDTGGIYHDLAKTLAILKMTYPNKDFSKQDILLYSGIVDGVSALATVSYDIYNTLDDVLDIGDNDFYKENDILFDLTKINPTIVVSKKPVQHTAEQKVVSLGPDKEYSKEVLLDEIESLRMKICATEQEKKSLMQQLHDCKRVISEQSGHEKEIEDYKQELTALRSHMYHITEYDEPADEASIDDMIKDLKSRKITIVGGHINWLNKLRTLFPDWDYISPGVSVSNNSRWITNADFVYFFTDTISHGVYNTYIQIVRERKISFGYIHGVNLSANIKQMWDEVCNEG